jgi:hypothetical protein
MKPMEKIVKEKKKRKVEVDENNPTRLFFNQFKGIGIENIKDIDKNTENHEFYYMNQKILNMENTKKGILSKHFYDCYVQWCEKNNISPAQHTYFSKQIASLVNHSTINFIFDKKQIKSWHFI